MKSIELITKYFVASLIALSLTVIYLKPVSAHIPFISNDNHGNAQNSLAIYDIAISKVIYQKLTFDSPESWITFKANQGDQLYFNLGIPLLEELKDFRPSIGLITPSSQISSVNALKESDVFPTFGITEPKTFYEPFTKTNSWTFREHKFTIPVTGNYYLVTYSPKGQIGKVWVSIGKEERFGPGDWISIPAKIPEIRNFHSSSIGAGIIGAEDKVERFNLVMPFSVIIICCLLIISLRRVFIRVFRIFNKK